MVGAAESTVSPSSSRTSRSTPCVLGCWGPMLTVIVSARISGIASYRVLSSAASTQRTERKTRTGLSLCVLGVLGVESAFDKGFLHDVAHHMQQRSMHFLHARGHLRRDVDVNRRRASDGA